MTTENELARTLLHQAAVGIIGAFNAARDLTAASEESREPLSTDPILDLAAEALFTRQLPLTDAVHSIIGELVDRPALCRVRGPRRICAIAVKLEDAHEGAKALLDRAFPSPSAIETLALEAALAKWDAVQSSLDAAETALDLTDEAAGPA